MPSRSKPIFSPVPTQRRNRFWATVVAGCIVVAALFTLTPALGFFTVPAGSEPFALHVVGTPAGIAAPTNFSCRWPTSAANPTSVDLSWTNGQSWSTTQIERNLNGGAYAASGNAVAAGTATVTNTAVTTPASNQYGWRAKAKQQLWESDYSSEITDERCVGAINELFDGVANSKLNSPHDVAFDSAGNMFIADSSNHRIRCVAAEGSPRCGATPGNIYTYVNTSGSSGTADATTAAAGKVNSPKGIWVDQHDNLLIADSSNGAVRIVYVGGSQPLYGQSGMEPGKIYTVAGSIGSTGYGGDGGGAVGGSAKLNPADIVTDANGVLFVADGSNHRIRCIAASAACASSGGNLYTFAGNGSSGWQADDVAPTSTRVATPTGITVNNDGSVIWTDRSNGRLRMVYRGGETYGVASPTPGNIYTITTASSTPWGIQADSANNLIVGDSGTNYVKVFFVDTAPRYGLTSPNDNTYSIVAGSGGGSYNGTGLPITGTGAAAIGGAYGVAINPTNPVDIYVADNSRHVIRRMDYTNGFTFTWAGTAGSSTYAADDVPAHGWEFSELDHGAIDAAGNIYFADAGDNRIRKWIPSCGCLVVAAGTGTASSNGDGGNPLLASINTPRGIHIDSAGNVYIAETGAHKIRMVPATGMTRFNQTMNAGSIYTIMGNGNQCGAGSSPCGDGLTLASANRLNSPRDVITDSAGNLIVSDGSNCELRFVSISTNPAWGLNSGGSLTLNGIHPLAGQQMSCSAGSSDVAAYNTTITTPDGMTFDGYGNLLFAETASAKVRLIAGSTGTMYGQSMTLGRIYTFAGGASCGTADGAATSAAQFCVPRDVTYNSATGAVYVADTGNDLVRKVANGVVSTLAGGGSTDPGDTGPGRGAVLADPSGVVVTPGGNLYVSQSSRDARVVVGPDP